MVKKKGSRIVHTHRWYWTRTEFFWYPMFLANMMTKVSTTLKFFPTLFHNTTQRSRFQSCRILPMFFDMRYQSCAMSKSTFTLFIRTSQTWNLEKKNREINTNKKNPSNKNSIYVDFDEPLQSVREGVLVASMLFCTANIDIFDRFDESVHDVLIWKRFEMP